MKRCCLNRHSGLALSNTVKLLGRNFTFCLYCMFGIPAIGMNGEEIAKILLPHMLLLERIMLRVYLIKFSAILFLDFFHF
nr:MAG TPA_asm: hypothetical protein [Caudoviricetes sp.]